MECLYRQSVTVLRHAGKGAIVHRINEHLKKLAKLRVSPGRCPGRQFADLC